MNDREICEFIQSQFEPLEFIPLHRPILGDPEKEYLNECIDSNFVSSVGIRVRDFEERLAAYTGRKRAVAVVNGTAALHIALQLVGAGAQSEVITQPLTFVATTNAIAYTGAVPYFVDVERKTLGMDPQKLLEFFERRVELRDGETVNQETGRRVAACVPVHIYGHPARTKRIREICDRYHVPMVEDAAEALGSLRGNHHVGGDGILCTLSFNGNKIITTGGGGAILTDDEELADRMKFLTTTAKHPHPYEFYHPEVGYNYRLPNLNAALGCAQMEQLDGFVRIKRDLAARYRDFFTGSEIAFLDEPPGTSSNFWLNGICFPDRMRRDSFLEYSNSHGVMSRPFWTLQTELPAFSSVHGEPIPVARDLYERCVAIPSSVPLKDPQ